MRIIPAILAKSEKEYKDKLQKIENSNQFDWVQIDLMDNKFVQNKSITSDVIKRNPVKIKMEAQLMVEYPENWVDDLIQVGVNRIVLPLEDTDSLDDTITHIKNHQIEVGLSLNPETEVEKVMSFLDRIDLVLVMSVHPGFGGQTFIPESIEKVERLKKLGGDFEIEVDGGINEDYVSDLIKAGADNLVIGSHLIEGDINENIQKIKSAI